MASVKRIDGRLQDENGRWVWNGESYEFVQSHTDWLPLTFQSQSDAAKFKKLENIYNAKQIIKNSKNPQEVLAAKQWLSLQGVKHDDMSDAMAYTYLYHSGKGKERVGHKYSFREWTGDGWRYFYDDVLGYKHKKEAKESAKDIYRTRAELHSAEKQLEKDEEWNNDISKERDKSKRDMEYSEQKLDSIPKYKSDERQEAYSDYIDKQYTYQTYDDIYRKSKYRVEKQIDKVKYLKIDLESYKEDYNKANEAYNKSIASKIDKGLKLVNKLFKKNK